MKFWHDFLDSLGTDGGRIFCLFALVGIGIFALKTNTPGSEGILTGAFGALLLALKTTGTNKDQQNSSNEKQNEKNDKAGNSDR